MKATPTKLPRAVFERLVREHHAAVYASAMRILRDGQAALDVTQDVYVALLEGRITLTGVDDERVLRWFSIRGSLQALRERANRRLREEHFAMQQPEARLDTRVQDLDTSSAVERFVARLPEELRAAVHLRFHEGLTFARIGEALEISEPAAHERVKRALEKLKEALSKAGLAAVAVDVEHALTAAPVTPPVPLFVAKQLVALHSGAASIPVAAAVIGSAALVAALAFVVPQWLGAPADEPRVAVAALQQEAPSQQKFEPSPMTEPPLVTTRASVPPQPPPTIQAGFSNSVVPPAAETEGTISGRVVDAQHLPAANLIVSASSVERQGKFSRWGARARTGADGRFEIQVVVGPDGVTNYTLGVEAREKFADRGAQDLVRVASGATVDVGVLKLAARASDRAGEFELALQIAAPDGPAADVRATLFRAVRSEDGWSDRTFEVQGKSDASGRVHLAGQHVGKKILVVDARDRGFTRVQREVELAPGAHTLSIALERGLEIRGRLVDVNGAPILRPPGESRYGDALQLHAVDPAVPGEWIFAALEDDGRFAFTALDALEYELDVSNGPWSSLCLDGVRAGTQDLLITLKRHDDPLARGNHCAEIHARLVDDATGKPVPVDIWAYEVAPLDPGTTTTTFDRDVAASLRLDRPAQRSLSGPQPPDSDHVHATSLDAGTYAFVVRAAGYAAEFAAPIVLAPHEMRNDVVLRLVQPTRVRGRVLDDVGRPCAGAFVFVNGIGAASAKRTQEFDRDVAETDGHPRAAVWELVQTDARGEFTIDGLSPRYDYVCEALHAQYRPVTGSKFSGQDPGVVELRFAKQR